MIIVNAVSKCRFKPLYIDLPNQACAIVSQCCNYFKLKPNKQNKFNKILDKAHIFRLYKNLLGISLQELSDIEFPSPLAVKFYVFGLVLKLKGLILACTMTATKTRVLTSIDVISNSNLVLK